MIFGIGVDIVQIDRIHAVYEKNPARFAEKVLSESELDEFADVKDKVNFLAKRFATKEAFAKALGTAFRDGLVMPDISVEHTEQGKPFIKLSGQALHIFEKKNIRYSHLSLSDEKDYVVANVVLEGRVRHQHK